MNAIITLFLSKAHILSADVPMKPISIIDRNYLWNSVSKKVGYKCTYCFKKLIIHNKKFLISNVN